MTFTTSIFCSYALLNRNSSLRESKIRITEICLSNPFRKYYAIKHSRRVHLWLCFVFSCLLLRGLDMERQHISRSYMGFLSAITLAVCLADMSASPLRSYPA